MTADDGARGGEPLRGELAAVVDGLAGRGPELPEVLDGPGERVDRLGVFRAFLLLPTWETVRSTPAWVARSEHAAGPWVSRVSGYRLRPQLVPRLS